MKALKVPFKLLSRAVSQEMSCDMHGYKCETKVSNIELILAEADKGYAYEICLGN